LTYNLKLKLFILIYFTLVDFAELLTDFGYTNFSVGLSNVECRCIGQTPCSLEHYLVFPTFTDRFFSFVHVVYLIGSNFNLDD